MIYAKTSQLWRSNLGAVILAPLDNLMRLAGHYLGAHGDRLPDWLRNRLSRDKKLMLGLSGAKKWGNRA
jgi:rhamnosyltransferase